jgi:drug/metabolite transporter (DMT)-like permease
MTVAVISAAVGLATNRTIRLTSDPIAWRSIFFCAVFAGAYMYFVQARFQRYMSEIKAVIVYSFEPMYGALIAMALLGERLSAKAWIGGACVIAAMVLADIKFKPRNGVPAE